MARSNAEHAAERLDTLMLDPLRFSIAERELVLVPTGELHAVPWAALPSCATRAVSVAPSAALWLRAAQRRAVPSGDDGPRARRRPGASEAAAEVRTLARRHAGATVLAPAKASVAAVAAALETATLAHIASHGTFRADNPLFSALELPTAR